MDTEAARRARRIAIKHSLLDAYDDEEACPPEWVDITAEVRERTEALRARLADETQRFVAHPDVRVALRRRGRITRHTIEEVAKLNEKIRRLNLIAPNSRFTRAALDADELLRPLYRSPRKAGGAMPSEPSARGPGTPLN